MCVCVCACACACACACVRVYIYNIYTYVLLLAMIIIMLSGIKINYVCSNDNTSSILIKSLVETLDETCEASAVV